VLRRQPGSLEPLHAESAPQELAPLVLAMNDYVRRLDEHMAGHGRFIAYASHQLRTGLTLLKTTGSEFWGYPKDRFTTLPETHDRVLATAVEYSKQRVQFGRSISTFQAIQHMLAELASCVAATIASAEAAARDADEGGLLDGGRFSIAAAKSQASEFAQRIASISHQSMGAMGFTHEHILHHYTRRLWVWRRDFGSETFWGEKIGQAYAKAGPDALWASLSASKYAA